MINEKCLVIYKNRPAIVSGFEAEKINIAVFKGDAVKVREKDIEVIYPFPCSMKDLEEAVPQPNIREAWELLAGDDSISDENSPGISLKELAELIYGVFSAGTAWASYELLREGLYFSGDIKSLKAKPRQMVEADEKKIADKQRESGDRALLLEKLKKLHPFKGSPPDHLQVDKRGSPSVLSETERRYLLDVEALALGKTNKSRTLKDLGKSESPEEAHDLLLASGAWTVWENPHPSRFGLSGESAGVIPPPPPEEERLDLGYLPAYAIDSPWSEDPDDAVSLEIHGKDDYTIWVHVADPASSIIPDSPADIEARGRGATLYLPEGPSRMLSPSALPFFALEGQKNLSPALSFKIKLKPDLCIGGVEIIPSLVKITRLSFAEADALIEGQDPVLTALAALAEQNVERRLNTGAVMIEFPEVHIQVDFGKEPGENNINIEPLFPYRSAAMIREAMIWAGEGAALWALERRLPFPFISQEAGDLPAKRLPGLAGAWQIRRCMRPRNLSVKPGVHWGLGLDVYTQVSSPLRRYTDLLCHQQIRSFLGAGAYRGRKPLGEEEVLFRSSAAEAAALLTTKAEKASRAHWTAVYLSLKKENFSWEAVVLDRKGNRGTVIIPALGIETQVNLRGNEEPNDKVLICLLHDKISNLELNFSTKL